MTKVLLPFLFAAVCFGVAFRYFQPGDLSWSAIASGGHSYIESTRKDMPDLALPNLENEPVALSSYKGKVVYIALWATWCGYCVQEIPRLIHLQREYEDQGFTIVAIAVDNNGEPVPRFVQNRRFFVDGESRLINYPVLFGNQQSAEAFGFHSLPVATLVNRKGQEVKVMHGVVKEDALAKEIEKLLEE
jgi:thiol-disulfide isomerase/thioredoxin